MMAPQRLLDASVPVDTRHARRRTALFTATTDFVSTARDALDVKARTGHAPHLSLGGAVVGTGGNGHGPLGAHGLGDEADRWERVCDGARAIAIPDAGTVRQRRAQQTRSLRHLGHRLGQPLVW